MFKKSIFGKIFGSLILILLLVEAVVFFVSIRQQRVSITENLVNRSKTLAKITSKQIETAYQAKTLPFETLEIIISESEDIVFLWLVKPDGEIYLANDPEIIMGKRIKEPFLGTEKTLIMDWTYPKGIEKIKLIVQPVEIRDEKGNPWTLLMGASLRSVAAAEKSVILNGFALFILTFLLTIYVSFYLTKKITNPLEKLKQGASIIGDGNLDYQIELKTGDEIEKLAEAFNKMTKDLKNSQKALGEELKRAKELDRIKTEFISMAAHQLRTPLSAVKWTIKMLIDGDIGSLTHEQKTFLTQGYISNERLISLVNDLLNVARIDEGRFGYKFALINLEDLIESVSRDFQHKIDEKRIHFTYSKSGISDPPRVKIDPSRLKMVIQNLLDNAIKYTLKEGKVTLSVKYSKVEVVVSFQDTGIGIPKNEQWRLFTKFFRSNNAIKAQTEGTGLGLFITKNIVEKHGGKIWFESKENKGTTFYFTIPIIS